jgi:hypothetical protein
VSRDDDEVVAEQARGLSGSLERRDRWSTEAARVRDKPFALVGVNGDSDPEAVKRAVRKYEIGWRSFKDARPGEHLVRLGGNRVAESVPGRPPGGRPQAAVWHPDVEELNRAVEGAQPGERPLGSCTAWPAARDFVRARVSM